MTDDRDRTREEAGYRHSRAEDRRLGITGQTQSTNSWPSWLNWALPLAALAGLLWFLTAPDRSAQHYSDRNTTTTAPGGTTTAPNKAPSGNR